MTKRTSLLFFCFSLLSSFVLLVSGQPPDSIMTYRLQHISCLGDSFTTEGISEGRGKVSSAENHVHQDYLRDADVLYL